MSTDTMPGITHVALTVSDIDRSVAWYTKVLGCEPVLDEDTGPFRHVVFPLSLQGVVTGVLLVFALSLGSFVTVMLMGTNATMVVPLLIYQQLSVASDWPFAAALGNLLLAIAVGLVALQLRQARRAAAS